MRLLKKDINKFNEYGYLIIKNFLKKKKLREYLIKWMT